MHATYSYPKYPFTPSEEQRTGAHPRHPVVVIGAGPVGLTAALDLAQKGVPVVVLDAEDTVSVGSRAVCYAKRALEIWDRLGAGQRMIDKGVVWKIGKVFNGDGLVYQFDLLPEPDHRSPPSSTSSNITWRIIWSPRPASRIGSSSAGCRASCRCGRRTTTPFFRSKPRTASTRWRRPG